jgi:hypothetical protein
MQQATTGISFTASDIVAYRDCQERFYHSQQRYPAANKVETDDLAARFSQAAHDTLTQLTREVGYAARSGKRPTVAASQARLNALLGQQLRAKRLNQADEAVAQRLVNAAPGLDLAAIQIIEDTSS